MKSKPKRRKNADDRLRRLERKAFETQDKEDIVAYWRACVQAGITPKHNHETQLHRGRSKDWTLHPKIEYDTSAEVALFPATGYIMIISDDPRQDRPIKTVLEGIKILLELEQENPPISISYTQRAYRRSPSGLWRGELKVYAKLGKKRVGKLYMECGNMELVGRPIATVSWIEVDTDLRRQGVATALYRAAAELACEKGYVLASDVQLREGSRGFWEKQRKRGNATLHRDQLGDKVRLRYMLDCPPVVNPGSMPKKRHPRHKEL